jgi:hypothetical protein
MEQRLVTFWLVSIENMSSFLQLYELIVQTLEMMIKFDAAPKI